MANWADPLQELLERVSDFCTISYVCISPDYIRMQSVCKSWHSILKTRMVQRELPWLMMLPTKEEEERDPDSRIFFSLSKQKIHTIPLPDMRGKRCCGSFKNGWLMNVDLKLDICLFHPWLQKRINLPH
ncbi:hypothetical protein MRB53_022724 [Persea americana]|uniref:Uncharacterized protein n=1 Tax=Persea americana TaxID=3435 RepID=A0ACC2L7L5_PERAE|nr:hypothetical protein MRB53_022724 [Persea americana]